MSKDKKLFLGDAITVGQLMEILKNENPNDVLIVQNPDRGSSESSLNVISVDTYSHDAITFTTQENSCLGISHSCILIGTGR